MKFKGLLKTMFHLFCTVTTFLLLFIGLQGIIHPQVVLFTGYDMLKLISVGFASVLPTFIFLGVYEYDSRLKTVLMYTIHFILTAGIVFSLLTFYKWIDTTNAIFAFLIFLVIYVGAHIIIDYRERQLAKALNKKLDAFHDTENETHEE